MTIENDFMQKMCNTNLDNINSMDFVLNLDLLNGCVHFCDGCFINKNKIVANPEEILDKAIEIAEGLSQKGLRFRELILGPTDFFSAKNTLSLLLNPKFQKLLTFNEKTRITASCVFDNIDKAHFIEIFKVLDNTELFREKMILEFLVPLNTKKMLSEDASYIEDNKWVLDFFKNSSPKVIDWSYVININNNDLLKNNYSRIVEFIKSEFNTIVEFNPGFFRTNNNKVVDNKLTYWKSFIQQIMQGNDFSDFCLTNLDKHHNTSNTICLNLIDDNVFFSPFIYEQIIDKSDAFKLSNLKAQTILDQHLLLQTSGFTYASKTSQCSDCEYLTSCVGRNVLNFMEANEKVDCLFPDAFRELA